MSLVAEGVAGGGFGQLGDDPQVAGVDHFGGEGFFAAQDGDRAEALFDALVLVPDARVRGHRAGIDAEVGQFADERIGGCFPDVGGQRTGIGGGQRLVAIFALRDHGRNFGGDGHQVDDRIQQWEDANFGCAGERRRPG